MTELVVKLISYVPGILPHAAGAFADEADLEEMTRGEIPANVVGILWAMVDGNPAAIMIVERAREIAEHLVTWSEGKPHEWFDVVFAEHGGRYAMALFPRINKSLERWRIAVALQTGIPPSKDVRVDVAFRPITFSSLSKSHVFDRVRHDLADEVRVFVVEAAGNDMSDPSSIPEEEFLELGSFRMSDGKGAVAWLEGYIRKCMEEE